MTSGVVRRLGRAGPARLSDAPARGRRRASTRRRRLRGPGRRRARRGSRPRSAVQSGRRPQGARLHSSRRPLLRRPTLDLKGRADRGGPSRARSCGRREAAGKKPRLPFLFPSRRRSALARGPPPRRPLRPARARREWSGEEGPAVGSRGAGLGRARIPDPPAARLDRHSRRRGPGGRYSRLLYHV